MSLTKLQVAELVQSIKSGGQAPSDYKIDQREIIKLVDMAFAYLLAKHYWIGRNEGEDIDGAFITAFKDNVVFYDSQREEYFTNLPAKFIKLPGGNDKGIRQVGGPSSLGSVFVKLSNGVVGAMASLESSLLAGNIGYYVEGSSLYFSDRNKDLDGSYNGKIKGISKVTIKMIASIDGLDEDADLPIPADMEMELITVIKTMLDEEKQTPVDDTNDTHTK